MCPEGAWVQEDESQSLSGRTGTALWAEGTICAKQEWPCRVYLRNVCSCCIVGASGLGLNHDWRPHKAVCVIRQPTKEMLASF